MRENSHQKVTARVFDLWVASMGTAVGVTSSVIAVSMGFCHILGYDEKEE